ncbi:hypothetical protein [Paenibacillus sp. 1001270B_150601_E10]|uniref:hypothetical protein n=1 Tax=Paenibacillus sp. 1001270B_150601_E10 TaxID=2787079 RepID=UPI00189CEBE7|nr:hypothetical protein [Paenibacillus sp. 1001270B_150601_E10]
MNNHAADMIVFWVSTVLLVFALTASFSLIEGASNNLALLDANNTAKDRNVHPILTAPTIHEIRGEHLVARILNMQDETVDFVVSGRRIKAHTDTTHMDFSFIQSKQVYRANEYRDDQGSLIEVHFD